MSTLVDLKYEESTGGNSFKTEQHNHLDAIEYKQVLQSLPSSVG